MTATLAGIAILALLASLNLGLHRSLLYPPPQFPLFWSSRGKCSYPPRASIGLQPHTSSPRLAGAGPK
jgi:hypothetical protein